MFWFSPPIKNNAIPLPAPGNVTPRMNKTVNMMYGKMAVKYTT
jgi:hypothetical protein